MGHSISSTGQFARITAPKTKRASVRSRDGMLAAMLPSILPTPAIDLARSLDREADAELSAGHIAAAERLAFRAAALRGWL